MTKPEKSINEYCPAIQTLIMRANAILANNSDNLYESGQLILRRCANCEAGVDLQVMEDNNHKLRVGKIFLHGHCRVEIIE